MFYSSHFAGDGALSEAARLAPILTLLSLLLISCGIRSIRCSSSTTTVHDNSTDMMLLLDFKRAITNDPRQALRSWHTGVPLCSWEGVYCSLANPGRVTGLDLGDLALSGPISPSLRNLTFLGRLDLSTNGFIGEIPPLNRLQRLGYLDLSYNSLRGFIPDTLTNYSNLVYLDLSTNSFTGEIPPLNLANNSLRGIIPDTLTNCSNLRYLDLSNNSLIGEIPHDIGHLSNLVTLNLDRNNLTGTIPPSLKNISQLEYIYLADNKLIGTIPDELEKFPSLVYSGLRGNWLSGGIPETLYKYNQSSLQILDFSFNVLGKTLPSNFGDTLLNLVYLSLYGNNFEGHLPASLGNISGLTTLGLSFNNFIAEVPSTFGNLGMLQYMYLEGNNLSGFIPAELGSLQ